MRSLAILFALTICSTTFAQTPARREIEYTGAVKLNAYAPRQTPGWSADPSARASTWRYYYSAPSYPYGCYYGPYYAPRRGFPRFIFASYGLYGGGW
jgi:hypothetical protein